MSPTAPPRASEAAVVADFLGEVPVFSPLSSREREELASRMRLRRYGKDEVIFHRDDPAAHFFVIIAGTLKITVSDELGHEVHVALLRGGEVFGELALLDEGSRSATVTAVTETQLLALARNDFFDVIERHPSSMRAMLTLLARTVRRASGRIEDLVFLDVPGRVAKCLVDICQARGGISEVDLTQDDLAAFVGATRVSVNRVLADLEQLGAISVGRRHIEIKDETKLRKQIRY